MSERWQRITRERGMPDGLRHRHASPDSPWTPGLYFLWRGGIPKQTRVKSSCSFSYIWEYFLIRHPNWIFLCLLSNACRVRTWFQRMGGGVEPREGGEFLLVKNMRSSSDNQCSCIISAVPHWAVVSAGLHPPELWCFPANVWCVLPSLPITCFYYPPLRMDFEHSCEYPVRSTEPQLVEKLQPQTSLKHASYIPEPSSTC